jgi:hypothetical protein
MKTLALIFVAAATLGSQILYAQGCLPEGITFTTQEEIDNFQANYPGCTEIIGYVVIDGYFGNITNLNGLSGLTSIGDGLFINSTYDLTNLTGLDNLTYIGGDVDLWHNWGLINLAGLDGLTSIGGGLHISWNESLISIASLVSLTSIGGVLYISGNPVISLTGLEGLTSVDGDIVIYSNWVLTSLTGLEGLNSIGGDLFIGIWEYGGNQSLTSLTGLEGLNSIGGILQISDNDELTSLTGLENIQSGSITDLRISYNPALTECNVQSICDYLAAPNGIVEIYNNGSGCNNPSEIANSCGFQVPCLPYGNYYFTSQQDIDIFQTNYPGCAEIEGAVIINDNVAGNITNLSGLSVLNSIEGNLIIDDNDGLTSLSGLDSIQANSIINLYIHYNSNLADCDIYSICQYITAPNGTIVFYNNAPGCNSPEEVILACQTAIDENKTEEPAIFPNPATSFITLTTPQGKPALEAVICNHLGQKVLTAKPVNNTVDVSGLKAGMYLIEISTKDRKERTKFVKNGIQ